MPERHFFWDPVSDSILQERDENGNVVVEYTREPDGSLISENRDGVERQYHFDPMGNTLALTDDNQNVTDTFAYNAFGEVTERTGTTPTPYQYHGKQGYYRDSETGEYHVQRRELDPSQGRWLSVDPLRDTGRLGPYIYVFNQPLRFVDPTGMFGVEMKSIAVSCDFKSGCLAGKLHGSKLFYRHGDKILPDAKNADGLIIGIAAVLKGGDCCCVDECANIDFVQGIFATYKGDKDPFFRHLDSTAGSAPYYGGTVFKGGGLERTSPQNKGKTKEELCKLYPPDVVKDIIDLQSVMFDRPNPGPDVKGVGLDPPKDGTITEAFETCAVCRMDDKKFTMLGCLKWGATYDYKKGVIDVTFAGFGPECSDGSMLKPLLKDKGFLDK